MLSLNAQAAIAADGDYSLSEGSDGSLYGTVANEADKIADDLTEAENSPESPTLAGYGARTLELSGEQRVGSTTEVAFAVPNNCVPRAQQNLLDCDFGVVTATPAVIGDNGESHSADLTMDADQLTVSFDPASAKSNSVVVNLYIGDQNEVESQEVAKEAMEWMIEAGDDEYASTEELAIKEEQLSDDSAALSEEDTADESSDNASAAVATESTWPDMTVQPVKTIKRPAKVTIPGSYVYCKAHKTGRCKPKSLHDYCTKSPDHHVANSNVPSPADFRGPCARHDMAIDKIRFKKISVKSKRSQRSGADTTLKKQIRQNCSYTYYKNAYTGERNRCYSAASVYYATVSARTKKWNGK